MSFKVKFWGVRGSIACPSSKYVLYGGNTSCVEVACDGQRVIFDCGTGMRNLGHWFLKKDTGRADILLSHTHWDHINGFPFFSPAFRQGYEFRIMAGHLAGSGMDIHAVMKTQMLNPVFPVPIEAMQARLTFADFTAGDDFELGRIKVRTAPLNHPNGATGYRLEFAGKSFCYVTDTEHVPDRPDENILGLIAGADLVAYDCTYTDREFAGKVGWGHSTWQEGIRLCRQAGAKQLAIFHHDPDHEDPFMDQIEAEARLAWSGALVARENMKIVLA